MIIGNGLIANAFRDADREDVVFFASGVSNSLETKAENFLREENLVKETIQKFTDKLFVYFSTCSIYDSSKNESPYVNHKLNMEHLIATNCPHYIIARVSNAVGKGGNPNLLMNYIHRSIQNGDKITIHKNAKRNLIDVEDLKNILIHIIEKEERNKIYNLAYLDNFSITDIVSTFERVLGKEAIKETLDMGESYSIDLHGLEDYFAEESPENYLKNLILKYYK